MSEPADLPFGVYRIVSLAAVTNPLTGIGPTLPESVPIHIDAAVHTWEIKPQGERGVYKLTLLSPFPYTGVRDDKVVVTKEESLDKDWRIYYWKKFDAYVIATLPIWPTPPRTLASKDPDAEIKVSLFAFEPWKEQQFKMVRIYD